MFNRLYLSPGKVGTNAACNYWSNLGSVHQVPITTGWTEAVWNTKFTRHFYTWPTLGIEPQTFWPWVQRPIHLATCSQGSCLVSRFHDNACSTDFTFPLARWAPMQPATIDPPLDLCTRYPLRLGRQRQCGIRSLPDTSAHGQHWESNPRSSDLESNALSTRPRAPLERMKH